MPATFERVAGRFWGTRTYVARASGWVAGLDSPSKGPSFRDDNDRQPEDGARSA